MGDYTLALAEARRGFDALSAEVAALRDRSAKVLGVGGLATSFVGGLSVQADKPLTLWAYIAIGFFMVLVTLSLTILWPRRFRLSQDPYELVAWAEMDDMTTPRMEKNLALHMADHYDENREKLDRLGTLYCWSVAVLVLQPAQAQPAPSCRPPARRGWRR